MRTPTPPRTSSSSAARRALVERATAFERACTLAASDHVEEAPLGVWQRSAAHPCMWVLNQLHVLGARHELTADLLLAELDRGLADVPHRRAQVLHDPTGRRLAAEMAGRPGWQIASLLVMVLTGEPPEPAPGVAREVDEETLRKLDRQITEQDPDLPDGVAAQLVEGRCALRRAVPGLRGFAGAHDGVDACTTTLYSDGATAQPEDVNTLAAHRGHGLAAATVSLATREALIAGHDLVFILCDGTDGPVPLYAGLGFTPLGRYWTFTKSSPPMPPSRRPPA